jgi:hypothetical protein
MGGRKKEKRKKTSILGTKRRNLLSLLPFLRVGEERTAGHL